MVFILSAGLIDGLGLSILAPIFESFEGGNVRHGKLSDIIAHMDSLTGMHVDASFLFTTLAVLFLFRAVLVRYREISLSKLRFVLISTLRIRLCNAIAHASWQYLSKSRGSDLSGALFGEVDRSSQAVFFALQLPTRFLAIAVHLLAAFWIAPGFSALALSTGLGLAWAMRGHLRRSLQLGQALTDANRSLNREVREFLGAVKLAKSYGAENQHVAAFSEQVHHVAGKMLSFSRGCANARFIQDVAGLAAVGAFLWAGRAVLQEPPSHLLLLAMIFYRLLLLSQEVQHSLQQSLHMLPSFFEVIEICEQCEAHTEFAEGSGAPAIAVGKEIRFQDVWFAHPGDRPPILQGVELVVPAGSVTVLSGPSGVGKSTLLDLLVGLLTPCRGQIKIDGTPLAELSIIGWRRSIAYVSQEVLLFHDSVRANLLWARPDASEADIREALTQAAADFVYDLPEGLDTVVGDRGSRLSGGERQRLALARALLRRPSLLILDEATAALDGANESLIAEMVLKLRGKTTVILVTHRPSAFVGADQELTIVNGRIRDARTPLGSAAGG